MDSLQREFDAAWTEFQSLESLRLVPETLESEWTRGRDTYLALLVSVDDPAVVSHLRGLIRQVEHIPGVEPYPESYWHVTIKGIGFEPDEVSSRDFKSIAERAKWAFAEQPPFEVAIGQVNGFPEVVFAEVWDGLPVRALNTRLLETVSELVAYPFDGQAFLPHVSIARFISDEGIAALKQALATLRTDQPGPCFLVREIHLVRAHLSAAAPTLETVETYRLPA